LNQKRYHLCQSIAGLERLIEEDEPINWLLVDGRIATNDEIEEAIKDAKAKGYEVLPPCDNVNSTGHCMGHDVPPTRIASCERGFERSTHASADWTEMPILVLPPPPAKPFFPECAGCKGIHSAAGISIMQGDLDVFQRVRICMITFRDVDQEIEVNDK